MGAWRSLPVCIRTGAHRLVRNHRHRHQRHLLLGIAKLVELGRLTLPCPVLDWLHQALGYPGVRLIDLSPDICAESTQLPGTVHRDPADQIIVATSRVLNAPLVTADAKILAYPHVKPAPA